MAVKPAYSTARPKVKKRKNDIRKKIKTVEQKSAIGNGAQARWMQVQSLHCNCWAVALIQDYLVLLVQPG